MTASAASAVSSSSVLAPSQSHSTSKPASRPTNAATAFQQSLNKYLQNTASGAGGANPTRTLSSSLMSSLLQMQA